MSGDGAPRVVCVPGLGLDGALWQPTIAELGTGVGPVVVTLPGFGVRPTPTDDLTPAGLGAQLAAGWLSDLDAPVVLAGHSASSQLVVHAAALVPDRVRAVVIVCPTIDPRAVSWSDLAGRWLRTVAREKPGQVPVLLRAWAHTGLWGMKRAMDEARRDDSLRAVAGLRSPLLVVRGPHDHICPEDWSHELVDAAPPGSTAVTLARGSHMVPLTHGDLVASAVRRFLATLG